MLLFFFCFVSLSDSLRTELSISFLVSSLLVFLQMEAAECILSVRIHWGTCGGRRSWNVEDITVQFKAS